MAETGIRIGKISSVNYETGMAQVVYTDRGNSVTAEMPLLSNNGEFTPPAIGSQVAVAHLGNGSSRGVILGNMWDKANTPEGGGAGTYRKEFSGAKGAAYAQFSDASGEYTIHAPFIILNGLNGAKITGMVMELEASGSMALIAPAFSVDASGTLTLKSGTSLALEDASYSTTLSEIMKRIEAVEKKVGD